MSNGLFLKGENLWR